MGPGEGRVETVKDIRFYMMLTIAFILFMVSCLLIIAIVLVRLMKKCCDLRAGARRVWNWFGACGIYEFKYRV